MTHTELCLLGAKYMKSKGITKYRKPKYVVVEIESVGIAQPDIYGFGTTLTQQIEVKVSRSDFLKDKKKRHKILGRDVGELRSYLCPENLIKPDELPEGWGLLYVNSENKIIEIIEPKKQNICSDEIHIICSIMRRVDIKSQIFSFKNYNTQL